MSAVQGDINFSGKDDRQEGAWIISSDSWIRSNNYLILPINPDSLEVAMHVRSAEIAMQSGSFMSVSRRTRGVSGRGNVYEFPTIAFKFNSGNIMPVFSEAFIAEVSHDWSNRESGLAMAGGQERRPNELTVGEHRYGAFKNMSFSTGPVGLYRSDIPVGIQNLYAMLNMMNESWMLYKLENNVPRSVLNRVIVKTNSLAFPNLTLFGFIDEGGLQWSESSDNFNNFDTSFNLVVTHTQPLISGMALSSMIEAYKHGMYGDATDTASSIRSSAAAHSAPVTAPDPVSIEAKSSSTTTSTAPVRAQPSDVLVPADAYLKPKTDNQKTFGTAPSDLANVTQG